MSLSISINRDTSLPIYQQIAEQVKTQISNGRLPPGSRLPTVRQMAQHAGVTRLTVQNAYGELQADGWIEATVGRGTFVSQGIQPHSAMSSVGQYLTADGVLSDMMQMNQMVGVRSLALAHPDENLFPADEFWHHLLRLQPEAAKLMSYGSIQGDPHLRVAIANLLAERDIIATPEQIVITSGAMQAITLLAQVLGSPGDTVIVEQPTFLGTLNILQVHHLNHLSVTVDEDGLRLDELELLVRRHRPRFLYTIATFHNPTGRCLSVERRRRLVQLAHAYDLYIIEDGIYSNLAYDEPPPPPIQTFDDYGRVIYLSSFSKELMPGLRTGYIVATDPWLRKQLLRIRRGTDLCDSVFTQRALAHFLSDGGLKRHLKRTVPVYRERRDTLLDALRKFMPAEVDWTYPYGGFCSWLSLPSYFAPGEFYRTALKHGLAFTPGDAYEMRSGTTEYLRLCFGNQNTAAIRAGVELLSQLIRQQAVRHKQFREDPSLWVPIM